MNAPNYSLANPQLKVSCPSPVAAVYPPVYHQCIQCFLYPHIQSCIHSLPHLGTHVVLCVHPLLVPCPWTHPLTPCPSLISGILAAIQGAGRRAWNREHREGRPRGCTVWQGGEPSREQSPCLWEGAGACERAWPVRKAGRAPRSRQHLD